MLPVVVWGTNLRAAREHAGYTRHGLAKLVCRHEATVGRWEAGIMAPKPAERVHLATILGVDFDALFPKVEPVVVTVARIVAKARTITELRRAVMHLRDELAAFDALNERTATCP